MYKTSKHGTFGKLSERRNNTALILSNQYPLQLLKKLKLLNLNMKSFWSKDKRKLMKLTNNCKLWKRKWRIWNKAQFESLQQQMIKLKASTLHLQLMLINYVKYKEHILKSRALRSQNKRELLDFRPRLLHNDDLSPLEESDHCSISQNECLDSRNGRLGVRCQVYVILKTIQDIRLVSL